jgi:hypothetical protein
VNVFAIHKDVTNEVIPIISERLQAELEIAHDNDLFPVIVWFIDDSSYQIEVQLEDIVGYSKYEWKTDIIKQSSIDQIHSYKLLKAEVATEHYNLINQGYIDCYLSDSKISFISKYSPIVIAEINKSTVKKLALSNQVDCIDLYCDDITWCSIETQVAKIDLARYFFSCSGSGVKIGIFDTEVPNTYDIPNCNIISTYGSNSSGSEISHAEYISNIIMSIAPDADYYLTGNTNVSYYETIEWLIDNGVDVINMSLGLGYNTSSYSNYSRWFDHIAYEHYVTFVTSIGNKSIDESNHYTIVGPVSECKMAYNILAVGGIDTNMTPDYYSDDFQAATIYSQSTSNVPYKPDICAPCGDSSSSSALITGVVALLMEEENVFTASPDSIKAVITACVNQSSPFQFLPKDRVTNPSIDSYMQFGAGLIDACSSLSCTTSQGFIIDMLTPSTTEKSYVIQVEESEEQKVSLAYLQPVDIVQYDHTNNNLTYASYSLVDLDLYIFDENDNMIDYSTTYENNVEIVHFTVPSGGTYTINVDRYGSQSTGSIVWFTIAWCDVGI